MSNSYFQFKEFKVQQEASAMKVSTDACILGAWTPVLPHVKCVLDAGTGTGLLSLMLCQKRNDLEIDAVEIDEMACAEAQQNVNQSPWAKQIKLHLNDLRQFELNRQYDLIICNPPFFNNSLLGLQESRNTARHTLNFNYEDLCKLLLRALSNKGYGSILLPVTERKYWEEQLKKYGLFINRLLYIKPNSIKIPNRIISICSKNELPIIEEELVIYNEPGKYTAEAIKLLKPYYLNL